MNVPLLDLKRQYQSLRTELEIAILNVAESQMLILGKEVENLEANLAKYCGTEYAIGVSSGTDALLMALMAIDVKPGDEVILPTYTFFATAGVVARLNAIPVFVDVDKLTFNINPGLIEKKITGKTKVIIPVHLFGQSCYMNELLYIGEKHSIPIIEDAAQAIGVQYKNGKKAGSMGLMGCFSFYPTKNLGGFGDGGLITTNDKMLADKLRQMRNHGMHPKYYHSFIGGNFRLDAIQAAVLNVKLKHLENWHNARRNNAQLYDRLFIESGLASNTGIINFDSNNVVLLPHAVFKEYEIKNYHIYNQYVICVKNRDGLRQYLTDNGIGTEIYYPLPVHNQRCFQYLDADDNDFPVANFLAAHSLALPIYPELTVDEINNVVGTINNFFKTN